jgi:hypothetical protein
MLIDCVSHSPPPHRRRSQFIDAFNEIFRTDGLKVLKTPVRTPVANTFAERWIGSIRRELLNQPEGLPRAITCHHHQLQRLVIDYTDQARPDIGHPQICDLRSDPTLQPLIRTRLAATSAALLTTSR